MFIHHRYTPAFRFIQRYDSKDLPAPTRPAGRTLPPAFIATREAGMKREAAVKAAAPRQKDRPL